MANTSLLLGVLSGSYPRRRLLRCSYSAQRAHMTHVRVLFLVGRPRNACLNAPRGAVLEGKTRAARPLRGPSGLATPSTVHDRAMAGKFLPLDDHDDDEEDSDGNCSAGVPQASGCDPAVWTIMIEWLLVMVI